MNKGKKLLGATLAMVCCASFATTAFAQTEEQTLSYRRQVVGEYLSSTWGVQNPETILSGLSYGTFQYYHDNVEDLKSHAEQVFGEIKDVWSWTGGACP